VACACLLASHSQRLAKSPATGHPPPTSLTQPPAIPLRCSALQLTRDKGCRVDLTFLGREDAWNVDYSDAWTTLEASCPHLSVAVVHTPGVHTADVISSALLQRIAPPTEAHVTLQVTAPAGFSPHCACHPLSPHFSCISATVGSSHSIILHPHPMPPSPLPLQMVLCCRSSLPQSWARFARCSSLRALQSPSSVTPRSTAFCAPAMPHLPVRGCPQMPRIREPHVRLSYHGTSQAVVEQR
jgi:hypothetical protein